MSGICGVWMFDEATISLTPILTRLEQRGPDGTREWNEGGVALGHALLATTPEALVEQLPFGDSASGCTITADARLDNREALIGALGLTGETRTIGDGELILRAYLKWAEDCPKHLLGDFAFAIWDARRQRLFCARDHMGMRQLIYHHAPGRLFAFATDAEALVAHPAVPRAINEARIADFLDDLEGIEFTSTFYDQVFRLPPAHTLVVDPNGLTMSRYWSLAPGFALMLKNDEAYAAAFLTVFTEAVRCRLRSAGKVGSMLSGGLDSGSVAAVAARLLGSTGDGPFRIYSAISPDADNCAESNAIRVALGIDGIEPTLVDQSALGPMLDDLWRLECKTGEPFEQHMTLIRAVYLAAKQSEVRVMLDGAAGDVVLTASNRVAAQLRQRQFRSAWTDACGEQAYWKISRYRFRSFFGGLWVAFVPNAIRRARRRLAWRIDDANLGLGRGMSPDFARRTGMRARRAAMRARTSLRDLPDLERRIEKISHPHLVAARERYDRTAAAIGIEPRDPFMDIRLIQFCLSLPADQMQRGGWPKHILRRATDGLLPDALRWRLGKEHLGWAFTKRLFDAFPDWRALLEESRPLLNPYVRRQRPDRDANPDKLERQYGLFVLARWLERQRDAHP